MTYVIYLGVDPKTGNYPDANIISELIDRHRTPTEGVVIKNTDEILDGGFKVFKDDDTLSGSLKKFENAKPASVEDLEKQAKIIRKGAEASHNSSVISGVTPYGKMTKKEIEIEEAKNATKGK